LNEAQLEHVFPAVCPPSPNTAQLALGAARSGWWGKLTHIELNSNTESQTHISTKRNEEDILFFRRQISHALWIFLFFPGPPSL